MLFHLPERVCVSYTLAEDCRRLSDHFLLSFNNLNFKKKNSALSPFHSKEAANIHFSPSSAHLYITSDLQFQKLTASVLFGTIL